MVRAQSLTLSDTKHTYEKVVVPRRMRREPYTDTRSRQMSEEFV